MKVITGLNLNVSNLSEEGRTNLSKLSAANILVGYNT